MKVFEVLSKPTYRDRSSYNIELPVSESIKAAVLSTHWALDNQVEVATKMLSDPGVQKIVLASITEYVQEYVKHVLADDFSEGGFEATADQDRYFEKVYLKMYKD